jgi:hypothetical protein
MAVDVEVIVVSYSDYCTSISESKVSSCWVNHHNIYEVRVGAISSCCCYQESISIMYCPKASLSSLERREGLLPFKLVSFSIYPLNWGVPLTINIKSSRYDLVCDHTSCNKDTLFSIVICTWSRNCSRYYAASSTFMHKFWEFYIAL